MYHIYMLENTEAVVKKKKQQSKKQKCLLFVESPGKCATIRKYLNEDENFEYEVVATIGHIQQLPSKNGSIKVENGEIIFQWEDKADSVKRLKDLIKKTAYDIYYIATDQDREGEGISYHIYNLLKAMEVKGEIHRITFNEITKKALQTSVQNPRTINYDLVHAFLSRLATDYLIGYTLSPLTWKFGKNYSVGRVQSPSVRLIIEQEQVIFDFVQTTYYMLEGVFKNLDLKPKLMEFYGIDGLQDEGLLNFLKENKGDVHKIPQEEWAQIILNTLLLPTYRTYHLAEILEKETFKAPPAPFTTVSLQQEANTKLNSSAMNTMRNAQKLYEEGWITYMRTDSTMISDEALDVIRAYIQKEFGEEYLSKEKIQYKGKVKNAQEAHEAIRPTDINNDGSLIVDDWNRSLYQLIWKRTVACQMSKCIYKKKDLVIKNNLCSMHLSGSQLFFLGYLKVYGREEDEDNLLPNLHLNEEMLLENMEQNLHKTKYPPRYTEGGLIKQLEKQGIGRPSTYVGIIEILKKREYVKIDNKALVGVMKGKILISFLNAYFPRYIDYSFTAQMEETLDKIANGEVNWKTTLCDFYEELQKDYQKVKNINLFEILSEMNKGLQKWLRHKLCEKCGHTYNLYIKNNLFFSCSNKECGATLSLKDEYTFSPVDTNSSADGGEKKPYVKFKKFTKKKITKKT